VDEQEFYNQKAVQIGAELPPSIFTNIVLDKQVRHIAPDLYKEKVILDVGCGDGRLVRYFAASGAKKAIGMDISCDYMKSRLMQKEFVVYYKRISPEGDGNGFFIQSDAGMLPVKNNSVETVVAFALLHHIPQKQNFISECRRVLVNGGRMIIVDPNGRHFLRNSMNKLGRKLGLLTEEESAIDITELKRLLDKFNFLIEQLKFESFFGDINAHLAAVVFKKNPLLGRMIQYLTPFYFAVDLLLDATLFKVFPSLAWRYFLLCKKKD